MVENVVLAGWNSYSPQKYIQTFTNYTTSQVLFSLFKMMENALEDRDAVGVSDAVLLDDPNDTAAFIENLRKRFRGDLIYVSLR